MQLSSSKQPNHNWICGLANGCTIQKVLFKEVHDRQHTKLSRLSSCISTIRLYVEIHQALGEETGGLQLCSSLKRSIFDKPMHKLPRNWPCGSWGWMHATDWNIFLISSTCKLTLVNMFINFMRHPAQPSSVVGSTWERWISCHDPPRIATSFCFPAHVSR